MLNLALVAVLSGTLLTGSPDGDKDKNKDQGRDDTPMMVVQNDDIADARSITTDTYAAGRPSSSAPIKIWAEYGYGTVEGLWLPNGDESPILPASGIITSQRIGVGAQLNVINFPSFSVGIGGELNAAQNEFEADGGLGTFDSGLGLQQAKVYGAARGRVVGIHGGYAIDLVDGSDAEIMFQRSDLRDAIFFGGDFDYPSDRFRLFGGIDYYIVQKKDYTDPNGNNVTLDGAPDVLAWTLGAGLRFGFFEIGAAAILRARMQHGLTNVQGMPSGSPSGNHHGSVAPYIKLSPGSLPVSLFVKGAVQNEYVDYGYAIGGGNDIKPSIGFTAGLTVGFD